MARDHQACINWETWQRQHRIKTKIKFISQVTTTFRIMNPGARDTLLPSHPLWEKHQNEISFTILWFLNSVSSQFVFSIERQTGSRRCACNRRLSVLLFYDIELRLQHWFRIKILFCGLNETTLWFQQSLLLEWKSKKRKTNQQHNEYINIIIILIRHPSHVCIVFHFELSFSVRQIAENKTTHLLTASYDDQHTHTTTQPTTR